MLYRNYSVEVKGAVFSFPVITAPGGKYQFVSNLQLSSWAKEQMQKTTKELMEERETALAIIAKL